MLYLHFSIQLKPSFNFNQFLCEVSQYLTKVQILKTERQSYVNVEIFYHTEIVYNTDALLTEQMIQKQTSVCVVEAP